MVELVAAKEAMIFAVEVADNLGINNAIRSNEDGLNSAGVIVADIGRVG